jgi:arabinogalactan oligomer / maltooligosaccharide transport system permease protein
VKPKQHREALAAMIAIVIVAVIGAIALLANLPDDVRVNRFVVVPNGFAFVLGAFALLIVATGGAAYAYGLATRPGRALAYAITSGTHLFLWGVIALTFYPVVYLLAVSFNRNDTLAGALPREGSVWVRSGVFPNPADFSLVQYQKVLEQTHLLPLQVMALVLLIALVIALIAFGVVAKWRGVTSHRQETVTRTLGLLIFGIAAATVISIGPGQFYGVGPGGERLPASSEKAIVLYIRNTLLVSGMTGIFAVLIATTAGYAFARMRFQGRYATLLGFIFVQMFPGFMALVAIFWLMVQLELLNTFTGLILAYSGGAISFSAWIFKGYLESISPALEESAMVDGATRWGAFWRIILPISTPMLLFIFLLQFIGTYSEFILANTLLQGQENWTVGMGLRNFTTGRFDTQWGALAASAVLGSIPILLIFYAFQDALTGSTTAGGVKG